MGRASSTYGNSRNSNPKRPRRRSQTPFAIDPRPPSGSVSVAHTHSVGAASATYGYHRRPLRGQFTNVSLDDGIQMWVTTRLSSQAFTFRASGTQNRNFKTGASCLYWFLEESLRSPCMQVHQILYAVRPASRRRAYLNPGMKKQAAETMPNIRCACSGQTAISTAVASNTAA